MILSYIQLRDLADTAPKDPLALLRRGYGERVVAIESTGRRRFHEAIARGKYAYPPVRVAERKEEEC